VFCREKKLWILLSIDEHTESRSFSYEDEYVKKNEGKRHILAHTISFAI